VILVASLNLNVALEVRHAGVWKVFAPLAVQSVGSLVVLPLLYRRFIDPPWDRDWRAVTVCGA
jgi:hypothetical protein